MGFPHPAKTPRKTFMKKLFLIVGICSFLAAAGLVFSRGDWNPFSQGRQWNLANKSRQGIIFLAEFSPDGEKLLIAVANESGKFSKRDVYLYKLGEKRLETLDITESESFICWAPDSRHIAFNQPLAYNRYQYEGCTFDTARNAIVDRQKLMFGGWR